MYGGQLRTFYKKTCYLCESSYWAYGKQKYCSRKCFTDSNRTKITVNCSYCGKNTNKRPKKLKNKTGKYFCGRDCQTKAQAFSGLSDYWASGKPNGGTSIDYRSKGFAAHGTYCQHCGYSDSKKMLDVHHKDGDRSNNKNNNLEPLCVWCHAIETRGVAGHPWRGNFVEKLKKYDISLRL